jgi:hypothetical protein
MYSIHPIVSHQLADAKLAELRRIAGHSRLHREDRHLTIRSRRRT